MLLTLGLATALAGGCRDGQRMRAGPFGQPPVGAGSPTSVPAGCTCEHGGILRGPRDRKRIALVFTGGGHGESTPVILDELRARNIKASFFVTGDYLRQPVHQPYLRRMIVDGHDLGPHSDAHLLYCAWEDRRRTLITHDQFDADLTRNIDDLVATGVPRAAIRFFIPPFEWYNETIVGWAAQRGLVLISFTPGTRSNADYLPDADPRFVSSQAIYRGILDREAREPDGLNGFLLLLHLGTGPRRTDKMHRFLGRLLDDLTGRGYAFVRVDELLGLVANEVTTSQPPAGPAPSD
ncbi:MAG: polysaccharide deacetylase family protein [Planctomycetes bacterium]|nr:polysaccharide deacetylase family protein [Planctomycetota bacterium]